MNVRVESTEFLEEVIRHYDLPGDIVEATQCLNGHINGTYRVILLTPEGIKDDLIVQKINHYVFKDPEKVMHNIEEVGRHVRSKKATSDCDIISFMNNKDGRNFTEVNGEYWRITRFVKDSITFDFVESSKVLYSAGYAFGRFQSLLSDLPMERLYETIPDFHNTKKRLDYFFDVVSKDPEGRAKDVKKEIDFFSKYYDFATELTRMTEAEEVPLRVTHNDTKYNNILMHKDTLEPLCVIDLDTVMPGLAMHDFGDAIRFAANTAAEDEVDLSKVGLNLEHYREFTRGFMSALQGLTRKEIDTMALGAITITIELASRFLTDHLNGDKYFRIHRPGHNLDRARCQIKLAEDMLEKYDEMREIVNESIASNEAATAIE